MNWYILSQNSNVYGSWLSPTGELILVHDERMHELSAEEIALREENFNQITDLYHRQDKIKNKVINDKNRRFYLPQDLLSNMVIRLGWARIVNKRNTNFFSINYFKQLTDIQKSMIIDMIIQQNPSKVYIEITLTMDDGEYTKEEALNFLNSSRISDKEIYKSPLAEFRH